jgi:uncharacterized protein
MDTPRLGIGQVRHLRLRPTRHAFSYGVFFLRLPLRALARKPFATTLFSCNRWNLLAFHEADHGDGKQPLLTWVDSLLRREGITDAQGEIWLQTFPRVLGYVFNPISFWFCHHADGSLRAVLCEVNNTFGERHCYLLETGGPVVAGMELRARKLFHVSPFCRVEGGYRFRFAHTPHQAGEGSAERVLARVDYDDANGPLLLTSVSGAMEELTDLAAVRAFLAHPLMTAAVMVRIHWQAFRLWLKRVPFFKKPPPPLHETSR